MKLAVMIASGAILAAFQVNAQEQQVFKNSMDRLNYGIGVETARNLKNQGVDVNLDLLIQGVKDGLSGRPLLVSEKELRGSIVSFQSELRRRQAVSKRLATMGNISSGVVRFK
ncbi:FKBP-type peptidyl-prolyl cis-trans isomerase N-terminal domain-containing protein [Geobacter argillaceus]|uniref:FKBP-type peptidyl-prolyl cis-trans isomerase FklB n=1 Tax=Geobacter argillaceus TaxID=345631 RepID=A0A562WTA3_9BACT|nr:FKBP-type peptidyl-prolyl cis-trans isomerase N-terminal domain-containing protein [Geobacter argillaceus]TWJ33596.1 FKBP-type peptidyl-prolyl cis-trans isomerase FklB [Geobacter argillaceus]